MRNDIKPVGVLEQQIMNRTGDGSVESVRECKRASNDILKDNI